MHLGNMFAGKKNPDLSLGWGKAQPVSLQWGFSPRQWHCHRKAQHWEPAACSDLCRCAGTVHGLSTTGNKIIPLNSWKYFEMCRFCNFFNFFSKIVMVPILQIVPFWIKLWNKFLNSLERLQCGNFGWDEIPRSLLSVEKCCFSDNKEAKGIPDCNQLMIAYFSML